LQLSWTSADFNDLLKQYFVANSTELRKAIGELDFSLNHYVDLDWRLDVQVNDDGFLAILPVEFNFLL